MGPGVRTKSAKGQASRVSPDGEGSCEEAPATTPRLPMLLPIGSDRGIIEGRMERRPPTRLNDEHPTALRRDSGTRIMRVGHAGVDVVPKLIIEVRRESGREPRVV